MSRGVETSCTVPLFLFLLMTFPISRTLADPADSTCFVQPNLVLTYDEYLSGNPFYVPTDVNSEHEISGVNTVFTIPVGSLTLTGITKAGTRSEGLATYLLAATQPKPELVTSIITYLPPGFLPKGEGPIYNLIFTAKPGLKMGSLLTLSFITKDGWAPNQAADSSTYKTYYPELVNGSIQISAEKPPDIEINLGDVNYNSVPYEIADWVYIANQIAYGIDSYINETRQTEAADVDWDGLPWTVSDLLQAKGVTAGLISSIVSPIPQRNVIHAPADSIWFDEFDVDPIGTVQVPIYFSNTLPAGALTFTLEYDRNALSLLTSDFSGSRIPSGWLSGVSVSESVDGIQLLAAPRDYLDSENDTMTTGSGLLVVLTFNILQPPEETLEFHFARYQHEGHMNGYATLTNGIWSFAALQGLEREVGFQFVSGDADGNGYIDIDDVVYLINYIFSGWPAPTPIERGDFNGDLVVDIDDATALLTYIFG